MSLFTIAELRSEFRSKFLAEKRINEDVNQYSARVLTEKYNKFSSETAYDIFLSHSIKDAVAILSLTRKLESNGLKVYVDWLTDPELDRSQVTTENAEKIRTRLKASNSLLMALSSNSKQSSWVQWELGLGDGQKNGKVAIIPLLIENDPNSNFHRQEYLGLYPYIDKFADTIFVNGKEIATLSKWLDFTDPMKELIYS